MTLNTVRTSPLRCTTQALLLTLLPLMSVACAGSGRTTESSAASEGGAVEALADAEAQRELREIKAAYAALQEQLRSSEQVAAAAPGTPTGQASLEALPGGDPVLDGVAWVGPHAGLPDTTHALETANQAPQADTVAMASYASEARVVPLISPDPAAGPLLGEAGLDEVVDRAATLLAEGSLHNAGARVERGIATVGLSLLDPNHEFRTELLDGLNTEEQGQTHRLHRVVDEVTRGLMAEDLAPLANAEASIFSSNTASEPPSLSIAGLQLCRKVTGFGVFEPFEDTRFTAGRPQRMIVYAEVEDFTARQVQTDAGGRYQVGLSQEVILYNDADGLVVWRDGPREVRDESRRRRRDFWVVQMITLPANLGVGQYRFKVRISDELGDTVDEKTLPLSLVADAAAPVVDPVPAGPGSNTGRDNLADATPAEDEAPSDATEALRLIRGLVK